MEKLKKGLIWVGWRVGVSLLAVLLIIGATPAADSLIPRNSPLGRILVQQLEKSTFTVGMAGVAYAVAPDYIVDGVDDNVEAQSALNALPATGGRIVFMGGNYNFSAAVFRTINNVTIEGDGKSTYFANDAGTALFSAGAQTGWVFSNFRTDAGYVTLAADTLVPTAWRDTTLIRDAFPLGGVVTRYVATTGTDDRNHGWSAGTGAYLTIAYAYSQLPLQLENTVIISIGAGTYNESLFISGHTMRGGESTESGRSKYIEFRGTLTALASATMDSAVAGTGATQGSITDAGAFGAYDNKLIYSASTGDYRIIDSDTANTATIAGTFTALPSGSYTVYDWGTTITGVVSAHVRDSTVVTRFTNLKFNGSQQDVDVGTSVLTYWFQDSFNSEITTEAQGYMLIVDSISTTATEVHHVGAQATMEVIRGKFLRTGAGILLNVLWSGLLLLDGGTVFDGTDKALGSIAFYVWYNSTLAVDGTYATATFGHIKVRNWNVGIDAVEGGGIAVGTANIDYATNNTNEFAVAGSFNYID
jgi:hypothetical protein